MPRHKALHTRNLRSDSVADLVKAGLHTSRLEAYGRAGGGSISRGRGYSTDSGNIFVKCNDTEEARDMFEGETASLKAILKTGAIRCPNPLAILDGPDDGAMLVTDYIHMTKLQRWHVQLGTQLAKMHLHNKQQTEKARLAEHTVTAAQVECVEKFGFPHVTRCGILPQCNAWKDDWVMFFTEKLDQQLQWVETKHGDQEARELWSQLQLTIPRFFPSDLKIVPALIHGDLWDGNAGDTDNGPVIFDPASFYGHAEYDFGIMNMFYGSRKMYSQMSDAYHSVIPKQQGHADRVLLYQLFHHVNHWNHFGRQYRGGTLSVMQQCIDKASAS